MKPMLHPSWAGALLAACSGATAAQCLIDRVTASTSPQDFGWSADLEGDRALIGAYADSSVLQWAGSAFVFERDDGGTPGEPLDDTWVEAARLVPEVPEYRGFFGISLALWDDTAFVGAPVRPDEPGSAGRVLVFQRDAGGDWLQLRELTPADGASGDRFGTLAVTGDTLFVGAPWHAQVGTHSGAVYVYRRDDAGTADPLDDDWIETERLLGSDSGAWEEFGSALACDGDLLVVGAPNDAQNGVDAGAVYVFERDDGGTPADPGDDAWVERAKLVASDGAAHDAFGSSVGVSGDTIAVAAPSAGLLQFHGGVVYLFERDDRGTPDPADDTWAQTAELATTEYLMSYFGWRMTFADDTVLVTALQSLTGGKVFAYGRDTRGTPDDRLDDAWVLTTTYRGIDVGTVGLGTGLAVAGREALLGNSGTLSGAGGPAMFAFVVPRTFPLEVSSEGLALEPGRSLSFTLDVGPCYAGEPYVLLGSVTGTSPGFQASGRTIPLVPDAYFDLTLAAPSTPPLAGFAGSLDAQGRASATWTVPPGVALALTGTTLHHLFWVFEPSPWSIRYVSNTVAFRFHFPGSRLAATPLDPATPAGGRVQR